MAFRGLEKILESIDLSANRLRQLPAGLFEDFDLVRGLKLNDNMLTLSPNVSFNGFRYIPICSYIALQRHVLMP